MRFCNRNRYVKNKMINFKIYIPDNTPHTSEDQLRQQQIDYSRTSNMNPEGIKI